MNHSFLYFKQGLLCGTAISGSLTYIFTTLYINKYYILIPNNISYFLDTYTKIIDNVNATD